MRKVTEIDIALSGSEFDTASVSHGSPYAFKPDRYSSHSLMLSQLAEGQGRRLLDVGAADGYLARLLTSRGFEVTCIEGNAELAELARKRCSSLLLSDLNKELPQLQGPYDVILYGDVLEHLQDPLATLAGLNHSLTDDGVVVISVPNVAHLWVRIQLLIGRFEYTNRGILDRTHLRFFTLSSFKRFLNQAGLSIDALFATPVPLPLVVPKRYQNGLFDLIHSFSAALSQRWKSMFAYQFVAICRRGTRT